MLRGSPQDCFWVGKWEKYNLYPDKAYKNENQARAEALKIASLENLTATDKELTKNSTVVELESSIAKKQPANIFLPEMYWVLWCPIERHKQWMEMNAQKDTRKDRRLEVKTEHAKEATCNWSTQGWACKWRVRNRSEERRVGKECSDECISRWSPYH